MMTRKPNLASIIRLPVIVTLVAALIALSSPLVLAGEVAEKDWGIAAGYRIARIPYPTEEKQVSDFIPLMFYGGDIFYVRGLTGGAKLYSRDQWRFDLKARYRYFDIPAEYQNLVRGNALDVGGELKYHLGDDLDTSIELMSDQNSRYYSTLNLNYYLESGPWELFPYVTLRIKDANFNNRYFGLDGASDPDNPANVFDNKIGSGIDLKFGSEVRYHVASNFYLLGRAQLTTLDGNTSDSVTIEDGTFGEVYVGVAFFNDRTKPKKSALESKPYWRIAHGWATPSNLGEIIAFDMKDDEQDNQLTSIFYGQPLADSLFGIQALDIYLTGGITYHHGSDPYQQTLKPGQGINSAEFVGVGDNPCDGTSDCTLTYDLQPTWEYVLGIKAYYNFAWPVRWRLGFTEGLSYIETVSNIEQREMDRKGYRSSKLNNYLGFSADFNLGDTFGARSMRDSYLGIGIHHRSSIFETSSAFGRIKGGSNYVTLYLQQHF